MRHASITEHSSHAMKIVVVVAIFATLIAFVGLSYSYSQNYAQRISCIHNQEEMSAAVASYAADNAGSNPTRIWSVRRMYTDRPENFATCPVNPDYVYEYDPKTGLVMCPCPKHRPR